ncbi:alpha/beta fold hydrolase [Nonomuraea jiangxiensis]|uniref:3-oxoadipate enol-lactonase n=1 Tax=Nonomuraea jiangxiensis TaxID=633440 RepID=A0A1G9WAF1_9ACTN|nr:alpha/beta fold hydrolase [Nonomuraea jiangxiensis]SDM81267.1 3-oxoadipate enol-lactonase [Nonomuraea jiangxiensis]
MTHPHAAPVVLLHPVALDAHVADWLDVPGLQALSLPGTGAPGAARPPGSLAELADRVAGRLTQPVHLAGCSLGGMVAMHVALRHPGLVLSLLAAFTTVRTDRDAVLARAEHTERAGAPALVDETLERWFTHEALTATPRPAPITYAAERLRTADTVALAATWRAIADHDVRDDLGRVGVPTTFVAGRRDRSVSIESVRAAASQVPVSRLVETDDAHMGLLEQPGRFSALVNAHVEWANSSHEIDH